MTDLHQHRIEGTPVRMTPQTKPNLAWRCACGWWRFADDDAYHPPATDEQIRMAWLERLERVM